MIEPRTYDEDEVTSIFARAVEVAEASVPSPPRRGMTLTELQDVAREVGLSPEAIARAASMVEGRRLRSIPRRRMFGLPIGVGRLVELRRDLSAPEWERLVVIAREVFGAQGRLAVTGGLREWSNGNLSVSVEPDEAGARLRLQTLNGVMREFLFLVPTALLMAVFVFVGMLGEERGPLLAMLLAGIGMGVFGWSAWRLTRWAQVRETQMEEIAERLAVREPEAHC